MEEEPGTKGKRKLMGKGEGNIHFDHPDHPEVAAGIMKQIEDQGGLLTNQERFDRIERAVVKIASYAPPEVQNEILKEFHNDKAEGT